MAIRQLTLGASATFDDGTSPVIPLAVVKRFQTITTSRPNCIVQQISTSGDLILLGAADGLGGTLLIVNLDPSNFVTVYRAAGPTNALARLDPDSDGDGNGGFFFVARTGSALTAPFAVADTGACRVAIFTCPP